jgi:catechol 2,3-dioxygenase-like lactoylglutathione lyase family enzyme
MNELHHAHLFASDIDATIRWWKTMLGAEVAYDGTMAGVRNVFLGIGRGRLHIYDQPPRDGAARGAIHHLGVKTDDLLGLAAHMRSQGAVFRSEIREFGDWRYIMTAAPDSVLLELFQIDLDAINPALAEYFGTRAIPPRP